MLLITYLILFFSAFSNVDGVETTRQPSEKYALKGKIFLDERSYGGMYREYNEETNAFPAHGVKLKVVRFDTKKPQVVGTVRSDVNGRFSIDLLPGTYGFIEMDDEPKKGQFLPQGFFKDGSETSSSSNWSCNINLPVTVKDKSASGVYLTNQRVYSCKRCP